MAQKGKAAKKQNSGAFFVMPNIWEISCEWQENML